jgi:hypothetical protein
VLRSRIVAVTREAVMREIDDEPERSLPELRPEARLAAAVIRQAVQDARTERMARERIRARAFLNRSDGLHFWTHVAGLPFEAVAALAAEMLEGSE